MAENALARETSPYLLQHKDNPVEWLPWGDEALARAEQEQKPILLSVGYAACHWCHVMAHESFENPEVAALMNELFVNIKVDREERPDLDTIYQSALATLGEQGGWPLTMFLTPKGEPFWGGTYFPSEPRYGRPGFPDVLRGIHDVYRREPDKVARNVAALRDALAAMSRRHPAVDVTLADIDSLAGQLVAAVDMTHGGLSQPPKFPHVPLFEMLWRAWLRRRDDRFRAAVAVTCERMCEGGIYDHLGGGFARYSTDAHWLVPHFEKMLYDNAQLIDLLTMVWQQTRNPLFATRIAETVGWVMRDMVAESGGFASSLDADSEGEEGKFYVWTEAEIDSLLGEDAALFKRAYDVTADGNWEGRNILNRSHAPDLSEAEEARLAELRADLLEHRDRRVRPGWDDKILADWNGLMIAALANAAIVFRHPQWRAAAEQAFAFVATRMTAEDGRLRHSYRRGQARHQAMLDDYANMARAALILYETNGEAGYLERARNWVEVLHSHYWDHAEGGYFLTADDARHLIVRTKSVNDAAIPAGNGVMLEVLVRLYHLTGDDSYRQRADALVAAFAGQLRQSAFGMTTFLNNIELLQAGRQVVVVGDRDDPATVALLDAVHAVSLPHKTVLVVPPGADLAASHPAAGKGQVDGLATAYVCIGTTCSLPATAPDALCDALAGDTPQAHG